MTTSLGDFLKPEGFAGPSGVRALTREGSVALELARSTRRRRADRRERGRAAYARAGRRPVVEPVVLVPGFMAGDWSLNRMGLALRDRGFRVYRSGINLNAGCTMRSAEALEARIEQIVARRGVPVSIIGHSLGGMMARGLAGKRPDLVSGIVTMGSPVLAPGAVHSTLGWNTRLLTRLSSAGLGQVMGADCVAGDCARESWEQVRAPLDPAVGFTAIYSRRDGIVDWRSCLDEAAEHVEVATSHVGMAFDPVVLDHVLAALRAQQVEREEAALTTASSTRAV